MFRFKLNPSLLATRRDDAGQFVEGGPSFTEGDSGYAAGFWLTREKCCPDEPELTVHLSYSGDATASVDYSSLPSQITFAEGQQNYWLPVSVNDDATAEWTETVVAQVASGSDYAASRVPAQVEILDNDAAMTGLPSVMEANYDADQNKELPDYRYAASLTDNDVYDLTLTVPQTLNPEARVRLVASASVNGGQIRVWPADDSSHSIIDSRDQDQQSHTWRAANLLAPLHLRAEAIHGSADIGDIVLTLSVIDSPNTQPVERGTTGVAVKLMWTDPTNENVVEPGAKAPDVLVGQHMHPFVQVTDPLGAGHYTLWDHPDGTIFDSWLASTQTGELIPFGEEDRFGRDDLQFAWADPGLRTIDVEVSFGDGTVISRSITVNVLKPSFTPPDTRTNVPTVLNNNRLILGGWPRGRGFVLAGVVDMPPGFRAQEGFWNFVQLTKPYREYTDVNGTKHTLTGNSLSSPVLDTSYPTMPHLKPYTTTAGGVTAYSTKDAHRSNDIDGDPNWQGAMSDDPDQDGLSGLKANSYTARDSFTTYVMFLPPGSGSQWVSLKKVDWSWSVTVTNRNGIWRPDNGFKPAAGDPPPDVVDCIVHPTWQGNVTSYRQWTPPVPA